MGYFLNHETNCETLKRWRMSVPPEIKPWFSPSNSNQVATTLFSFMRGRSRSIFPISLEEIAFSRFASALPNPGFYLQMTSIWAQKDQLLMAMPRENVIKTNLLFQQLAIVHFFWSKHSTLNWSKWRTVALTNCKNFKWKKGNSKMNSTEL